MKSHRKHCPINRNKLRATSTYIFISLLSTYDTLTYFLKFVASSPPPSYYTAVWARQHEAPNLGEPEIFLLLGRHLQTSLSIGYYYIGLSVGYTTEPFSPPNLAFSKKWALLSYWVLCHRRAYTAVTDCTSYTRPSEKPVVCAIEVSHTACKYEFDKTFERTTVSCCYFKFVYKQNRTTAVVVWGEKYKNRE